MRRMSSRNGSRNTLVVTIACSSPDGGDGTSSIHAVASVLRLVRHPPPPCLTTQRYRWGGARLSLPAAERQRGQTGHLRSIWRRRFLATPTLTFCCLSVISVSGLVLLSFLEGRRPSCHNRLWPQAWRHFVVTGAPATGAGVAELGCSGDPREIQVASWRRRTLWDYDSTWSRYTGSTHSTCQCCSCATSGGAVAGGRAHSHEQMFWRTFRHPSKSAQPPARHHFNPAQAH